MIIGIIFFCMVDVVCVVGVLKMMVLWVLVGGSVLFEICVCV